MQINRKYRLKTMFTGISLHQNNYTTEKNNLQGKICLLSKYHVASSLYYSASVFQSFIVLAFSSKELPISTIFFPPVVYCAA